MLSIGIPRVKRFFVALCLAMAFVYAVGSTTQLINGLQHSGPQASAHEHSVLSDALVTQADHHTADHHAGEDHADAADDQTQDDMVGGHHHHGDTGPSLLATLGTELPRAMLFGTMLAFAGDQHIVGISVPGPERPPMVLKLAA